MYNSNVLSQSKLLQWCVLWQERAFAAKLSNTLCETFAVTCPMTRTGLCCETLQLTLWNFFSDVPYDKNGPLLRNFATNFVKLLRWRALWQAQAIAFVKLLQWRALWQEQAFHSKLCNLICETFVVTCPLTRSGLCWDTLQLTLWNFCGDRPLLWNVHWCHWRNPSSLASLLYSFNHLDNQ